MNQSFKLGVWSLCYSFVLLALPALSFAQEADAYARAVVVTSVRDDGRPADVATLVRHDPRMPPSPLNEVFDIETGTASEGKGVWVYADDSGRVRLGAETRADRSIAEGDTTMWWSQLFQKSADNETPSYVVNPTELRYFLGKEAIFEFLVGVQCFENQDAVRSHKFSYTNEVLSQYARIGMRENGDIGYFHASGRLDGVDVPDGGPLLVDQEFGVPNNGDIPTALLRTTFGFSGDIDISACPIKHYYRITYILRASALDQGSESSAYAFVGDPLEPDTGFQLKSIGSPVEGASRSGQLCNSSTPSTRFVDHGDGTTTDRQTGLIWQRCPLDYLYGDNGTPAVHDDDICEPVGGKQSWSSVLLTAEVHEFAGANDWRLPNIKELESIVDLSCGAPAITSAIFPDTPAGDFWSSTPDPLDGFSAKVVDMHMGSVYSRSKTEIGGHSRLVRDSLLVPAAPLAGVKLGNAQTVAEGNGGNVGNDHTLVFPVRLTRLETSDVSISYLTEDDSATAGKDYVATTGTLLIPAGEISGEILVPLIGDDLAEPGELVVLTLTSSSANVDIVANRALGEIRDDEPRIQILSPQDYEGDTGQRDIQFSVVLDRLATTGIDFEFSAGDDTATILGNDFVPISGLVSIAAGSGSTTFVVPIVGDQISEGTERFKITLSEPNPKNAHLSSATVYGYIVDDEGGTMNALNDTGVETCADQFTAFAACPQSEFPGQDAEYGRDSEFNDDSDGYAGMVLSKLDASGVALADQSVDYAVTPWDCVADQVTGLMWEVKSTNSGLRHNEWTYTWYTSTGINDGGDAGTANGGVCVDATSCDTEAFATAVNAAGLCGHTDWRLPTRSELLSLDTNLAGAAAFDEAYFPNARVGLFAWWTSTPAISWSFTEQRLLENEAWYLNMFSAANVIKSPKSSQLSVRLVRND